MKSALTYFLTSALLWLILFFVASFSLRQSVILALLIALLSLEVSQRSPKLFARFSPYWVHVKPNWFQILSDYNFLQNQEEWGALQKIMGTLPDTSKNKAVNGFFYTVVQNSPDGEQMLLYLNDCHVFVTEVDFADRLRPFGLDSKAWPEPLEQIGSVGTFMKWGIDGGYNLGISVDMNWWKEMKLKCPAVLREEYDHPCGCVNLTLAVLPYKEFGMYWNPIEWRSNYGDKLWAEIREARKKRERLEKEEPDSVFGRNAKNIVHKYFDVHHDSI